VHLGVVLTAGGQTTSSISLITPSNSLVPAGLEDDRGGARRLDVGSACRAIYAVEIANRRSGPGPDLVAARQDVFEAHGLGGALQLGLQPVERVQALLKRRVSEKMSSRTSSSARG